jgi:hypothetical protein
MQLETAREISPGPTPKPVSFDRTSNLFYTFITDFQQPRQAWSLRRIPHL